MTIPPERRVVLEEHGRLGDRVQAARARGLVGREPERALFREALAGDPPPFAVLFVFGPGGIGKSVLLAMLADEARAAGRRAVSISGDDLPPAPEAVLRAIGRALGVPVSETADLAGALGGERPSVLLVDALEKLTGLEEWFRLHLLPALPASALVVLAGREPPPATLRADPGWGHLVRVVSLRNLDGEESSRLLALRGVDPALHAQAHAETHGHPLALSLVADVLQGGAPAGALLSPDVVQALLRTFLERVPSPLHRSALEVCAHARVTDESLLRAIFGEPAPELFAWLRGLSFIRAGEAGLSPHDLARDVVDNDLWWRDRERYQQMHGRVRGAVIERVLRAPSALRTDVFQDLLFMHRRSRVVSRFLQGSAAGGFSVVPLTPDRVTETVAVARAREGAVSAEVTAHWARRRPECFHLFQDAASGTIDGFLLQLELEEALREDRRADPGLDAVWRVVEATAPLRTGERVVLMRQKITDGRWDEVSPHTDTVAALCCVGWLTTPRLAWAFMMTARPEVWSPWWEYLDFRRLGGAVPTGDLQYAIFGHDFRVLPQDAWLAAMEQRELSQAEAEPVPLRPDPPLLALSRADFEMAVRALLRDFHLPSALQKNPLLRCRVALAGPGPGDPADRVRALVTAAVHELEGHPRRQRLAAALDATYLRPAPTQERAAERLGLPFSSYRRHLTQGLAWLTERLWQQELSG